MGQYYITANLPKREFVYPPSLGDRLKLAEQAESGGGCTDSALVLSLFASNGCVEGSAAPQTPTDCPRRSHD